MIISKSRIFFLVNIILVISLLVGCSPDQTSPEPVLDTPQELTPTAVVKNEEEVNEIQPTEETQSDTQYLPQVIQSDLHQELFTLLNGLDINQFFEVSFRELTLRDPDSVLELGLMEILGVEEVELTDISESYTRETQQMVETILEMLRSYNRENLTPEQQLSFDIYEWYLADWVHSYEFLYNQFTLNHFITSVHWQMLQFFTENHPINNQQDARDYVTRLSQLDTKYEQLIDGLITREQAGVIPPRFTIQWALSEIRRIATSSPPSTPFYSILREKLDLVDGISESDKQALLESANNTISEVVIPAYQELVEYLEGLESRAPTSVGSWQYPDGDNYYAYTLHHHTTTNFTAEEIHELGKMEVQRIQADMREIFNELGYPQDESLPELYNRVANDSGYIPSDQVVETYEMIIEEADRNIDVAFDIRPQAEVIVIGGPIGGFYQRASIDGSRPGAFYAQNTRQEPLFSMPTLAYHETIPGHHLQIAIAQELTGLPSFRNHVGFTGYVEGWALYAERLASELGWYDNDPYGELGLLQAEAFRAVRLVVDTGIHAMGWSYDEAVDYMTENTGKPREWVNYQISRYVVWPGQSTSYMIGFLKIMELRHKAMDALGEDFELKEFHNVVLKNGSMPLETLELVVQDYIDNKLTQ
jgi:uncharacterized protein (DUF885 family)